MSNINAALGPLAVSLDSLHEDPKNVRKHSSRNLGAIKASLAEHGQQKPVVVLKDGTIVAGNGTYRAARELGWVQIAAVQYSGAKAKAKRFAIQDNRSGELAEWDKDALGEALADLADNDGFEALELGFSESEVEKLIAQYEADDPLDAIAESDMDAQADLAAAPTTGGPSQALGPPSHVRMVQLFLNADNHPPFMDALRQLGKYYKVASVTDTVLKAVEVAVAAAKADAAAA